MTPRRNATQPRRHHKASPLLAGLLALACLLALPWAAQARDRAPFSNIDAAVQMYDQSQQAEPSRVGREEFKAIIRDRVQCYDKVTAPLGRKRLCNIAYVDAIIHTAREKLKSAPRLGLFIGVVQYCPIVYSMCIGENMNGESCVAVERQCIDITLDKYWRGAPTQGPRD